jgi:hypothetical protein
MIFAAVQDDSLTVDVAWTIAASRASDKLMDYAILRVPVDGPGWIATGLIISKGQKITLLAHGQVWLSREANLAFGPNVALWYRIGSGLIARSAANSMTFEAKDEGALFLIAKPPGEWANRNGDFLPDYPHTGATGELQVAVLAWAGSIDEGLQAFALNDKTGAARTEIKRRASEKPIPKGWMPLWRTGETRVFCEEIDEQGQAIIACRCVYDSAILKRRLDLPLDASVRLDWSWRVKKLPSRLAENTLATHDYLSIAVEFENGQDIAYLWSSCLPEGTVFRCPIAWWDKHETHIVRRCGNADLGTWVNESRAVLDDYRSAVGGPLPDRITGVWLIGLSPFQRTTGECDFRGIQVRTATKTDWIGP